MKKKMTARMGALLAAASLAVLASSCQGGSKVEIPVSQGQKYVLQPSGKLKVYAAAEAGSAPDAQPLEKLRVKRKNETAGAAATGCWQCSDCICNGQECACTECTGC